MVWKKLHLVSLLALSLAAAACSADTSDDSASTSADTSSSSSSGGGEVAAEKHWGYEDSAETVGPDSWGDLDGNALCSEGDEQTPIDIVESTLTHEDLALLTPAYATSVPLQLKNNGHTVVATIPEGSTLEVAGETLNVAQFHFHAPSEHTINGEHFPLELHVVHLDGAGNPAAVLGVLFSEGAENTELAAVFDNIPEAKDETAAPANVSLDLSAIVAASDLADNYVTYDGSLTTPPCTEGLTWLLEWPAGQMTVSKAQLEQLAAIPNMTGNNRPTQPLNGRKVSVRK